MNTTLKLDLWWVIRQVRKNLGGGVAKEALSKRRGTKARSRNKTFGTLSRNCLQVGRLGCKWKPVRDELRGWISRLRYK